MTKKIHLLLAMLTVVLALAGCGAGVAPQGAVVAPQVPAAEESLVDLPVTLDVDTVASLQGRDDVYMLDVREQWEYDEGHIPEITLLPMGEIPNRLSEIPQDKTVIVTCRSGNRSGQVTDFLRQNGFDNVHNMDGGILAWEQAGYPVSR